MVFVRCYKEKFKCLIGENKSPLNLWNCPGVYFIRSKTVWHLHQFSVPRAGTVLPGLSEPVPERGPAPSSRRLPPPRPEGPGGESWSARELPPSRGAERRWEEAGVLDGRRAGRGRWEAAPLRGRGWTMAAGSGSPAGWGPCGSPGGGRRAAPACMAAPGRAVAVRARRAGGCKCPLTAHPPLFFRGWGGCPWITRA